MSKKENLGTGKSIEKPETTSRKTEDMRYSQQLHLPLPSVHQNVDMHANILGHANSNLFKIVHICH